MNTNSTDLALNSNFDIACTIHPSCNLTDDKVSDVYQSRSFFLGEPSAYSAFTAKPRNKEPKKFTCLSSKDVENLVEEPKKGLVIKMQDGKIVSDDKDLSIQGAVEQLNYLKDGLSEALKWLEGPTPAHLDKRREFLETASMDEIKKIGRRIGGIENFSCKTDLEMGRPLKGLTKSWLKPILEVSRSAMEEAILEKLDLLKVEIQNLPLDGSEAFTMKFRDLFEGVKTLFSQAKLIEENMFPKDEKVLLSLLMEAVNLFDSKLKEHETLLKKK